MEWFLPLNFHRMVNCSRPAIGTVRLKFGMLRTTNALRKCSGQDNLIGLLDSFFHLMDNASPLLVEDMMQFTSDVLKPVNRSQNSPLTKRSNLAIAPVASRLPSHLTEDSSSEQLPKIPSQSGISEPVNGLLISQDIHIRYLRYFFRHLVSL